jgi:hypothetical protein
MSDLDNTRAEIVDVKRKLALAEENGNVTLITVYVNLLTSLQNTVTELLKQSAQPGN